MRRSSGFTLIELLIVVAVIGVIATIAIPNLLNAVQRGKQKRTMGDIRALATATELYAVDNNDAVQAPPGVVDAIASYLEPTYVKAAPRRDGWGTPLQYEGAGRDYTFTSYGRDKAPGGGGAVSPEGTTTSFANDIIYNVGSFVQYPAGMQE